MVVRRVAVLALLVALAGCQEESADPPSPKPSPTVTESPTESPSAPVEPDMPAAAKEPTQAGAEAFVRYYWDLVNYAQATGDTGEVRAVSSSTCVACLGSADAVDAIYKRGGVIQGGAYEVRSAEATELKSRATTFRVDLTIANARQVVEYEGVEKDAVYAPSVTKMRMHIDYLDGAWSASIVEQIR